MLSFPNVVIGNPEVLIPASDCSRGQVQTDWDTDCCDEFQHWYETPHPPHPSNECGDCSMYDYDYDNCK